MVTEVYLRLKQKNLDNVADIQTQVLLVTKNKLLKIKIDKLNLIASGTMRSKNTLRTISLSLGRKLMVFIRQNCSLFSLYIVNNFPSSFKLLVLCL